MHAPTAPRRVPTGTLGRIVLALIVAALFLTDGMLAARQFDAWYLARSIAREDDRERCPIEPTSIGAGVLDQLC
jgi:hypothetical protein